jgi:ABC-type branched-subunit amino acid transport system ATPase component
LRLGEGQALYFVGPNGTGKSTVLHEIFGFARIFSGSIRLRGADIRALAPECKARGCAARVCAAAGLQCFPDM